MVSMSGLKRGAVLLLLLAIALGQDQSDFCSFTDPATGDSYDLRGLRNETKDWTYEMKEGFQDAKYYINFCRPTFFVCGDPPAPGVAGLCKDESGFQEPIGTFLGTTAQALTTEKGVVYQYATGQDWYHEAATSKIEILCDPAEEGLGIISVVNSNGKSYVIQAKSKWACPIGDDDGLSLGWILIITMVVALFVYIVGGVLVNKFALKKETSIELLPHLDMWKAAPGLIKDGVVYTAFKIRHPKETPTYSSV